MSSFEQDSAHLLWPGGSPGALGDAAEDQPQLTVHMPEAAPNARAPTGAGIIVAPGGGYRTLASDHEGLQVARWLNRHGVAAFVLRYRVGERYHSETSLLDGQRAVRWVRHHAAALGIRPDAIGMLGFSAGGHLSCNVGTRFLDECRRADDVDAESARPDFIVPVYAVTNGEERGRKADEYLPTDTRVTAETPPAFIVSNTEDSIVPASQSTLFYDALLKAGVPVELHIYGFGEHGMGLGAGDPVASGWPELLLAWLGSLGFLTAEPRVAVRGRVTVAGEAPGKAWITFDPLDPTRPVARVRFNRSSDGAFEIPASHGPVAGLHQVTVRVLSNRYPETADGAYSINDMEAHIEDDVDVQPDAPLTFDF